MIPYMMCLWCEEVSPLRKDGKTQTCSCELSSVSFLGGKLFKYSGDAHIVHKPSFELEEYAQKRGMIQFLTKEGKHAFAVDSEYYIESRDGKNLFLYSAKNGFIGRFSKMKHAYKRYKKELNNAGTRIH